MQKIIQKSDSTIINSFNLDSEFDDIDFRPVTKGLGFHQEAPSAKRAGTNKSSFTIARHIHHNSNRSLTQNISKSVRYEEREVKMNIRKAKPISKKINKKIIKNARMGLQFTSFVFDIIIILSLQLVLNVIFLKVVNLSNLSHFLEFTWMEQIALLSFIFVFYFTILDIVGSPGKKIFSLRLVSTGNKELRIDQTLLRSVITITSFLLFSMPTLFDFQGKLSDTKLIEDV